MRLIVNNETDIGEYLKYHYHDYKDITAAELRFLNQMLFEKLRDIGASPDYKRGQITYSTALGVMLNSGELVKICDEKISELRANEQ